DVGNGRVRILGAFTNSGQLVATNLATLDIGGDNFSGASMAPWVNVGSVAVQNATVYIGGQFTSAAIGAFNRGPGATVALNGVMLNAGVNFDPATFVGGNINVTGGT